jgi:hypothetical protein
MGTFPETAIVDCLLSFADQGKQTFLFCLQQTNGSCRFLLIPFSVCVYVYVCLYGAISKGKGKTEAQAIFLNLFIICSLCK